MEKKLFRVTCYAIIVASIIAAIWALAGCGPKTSGPPEDSDVWVPPVVITPYTSCEEAGGALASEDPGYNPALDPNGDGVMCDPMENPS